MSDNDEKTVQKNLNLRESYAEALEEAAKEIYGSSYKQARVVEALLDETRFQPDSQRIKDDLRKNGFGIDPIQRQEEEEDEPDASEMWVAERMSQLKELDVDRGETVAFRVGDVEFLGVEPCERCVVPSRDSETGEPDPGFRERFVRKRHETRPSWLDSDRYDHDYRLMVITRVPECEWGSSIEVGDEIEVLDVRRTDADR